MAGDQSSATLLGVRVVAGGGGLTGRAQVLCAGRHRATGLTVARRVQLQG